MLAKWQAIPEPIIRILSLQLFFKLCSVRGLYLLYIRSQKVLSIDILILFQLDVLIASESSVLSKYVFLLN
jgi:hypothetical protein